MFSIQWLFLLRFQPRRSGWALLNKSKVACLYGGLTVLPGKACERGQGTCSEMLFSPDFENHFEEARDCKEISKTFYAHHQRILHVLMNPVVKKFNTGFVRTWRIRWWWAQKVSLISLRSLASPKWLSKTGQKSISLHVPWPLSQAFPDKTVTPPPRISKCLEQQNKHYLLLNFFKRPRIFM